MTSVEQLSDVPSPSRTSSNKLLNSLAHSSSFKSNDDTFLFETPSELLCPITHELFKDPVVSEVGQVYERAAIVAAIQNSKRDPLTGQPLVTCSLTPVQLVKRSAQEYRENSARQCIERACSRSCTTPVKYLRRTAELLTGCELQLPGFSTEFTAYVLSHTSNAYDMKVLQLYAQTLQATGYLDAAANVFYNLLQMGEDRVQQAEILKQCLRCWMGDNTNAPDNFAVNKLITFIKAQDSFSWSQTIDIMTEAGIDSTLVCQACESFLQHSGQAVDAGQRTELMLRYIKLQCATLHGGQTAINERLRQLEAEVANDITRQNDQDSRPPSPRGLRAKVKQASRNRLITAAVLAAINVMSARSPLMRLVGMLPLVFHINEGLRS